MKINNISISQRSEKVNVKEMRTRPHNIGDVAYKLIVQNCQQPMGAYKEIPTPDIVSE